MKHVSGLFKKTIALIVGVPLLIIGLILIPLPGPGFLTTFIALYVLSLAFERPKKYFDKSKEVIYKMYEEAKKKADAIEGKGDKK